MTYFLIFYVPVLMAYFSQDCCTYLYSDQHRCNPRRVVGHECGFVCQLFALVPNYFFLMDLLLNFITGYEVEDGGMEYGLASIWKNYLTTWFALDIISCLPLDCILTAAANDINWYNCGQYIRCLRVFAINRRARGNPFRWVDTISDVRKEFSYSARRIINSAVLTWIGLHYFACLLWFIVRVQDFPEVTWPVQLDVMDAPVGQQYLWSIFNTISGMIGLGYGAFPPRTWLEALIWCFAMVTLASLFAVVNGFILSAILSSASARQKYKERMDLILSATRSRELPEALRTRILSYLKFKYIHRPLQDETSIWSELPSDMQVQVALASTSALLKKVPILARDEMLLERVALLLRPAYAIAGQEILRQGWPATTMFFVRSGFVDLQVNKQVADTLSDGQFFGEAALLIVPSDEECREKLKCEPEEISNYTDAFTAVVGAKALTNCELYALSGAAFHELVDDYPTALEEIQSISLRYAERIRQSEGAHLFMHRSMLPGGNAGSLAGLASSRASTLTYSRIASSGLAGTPFGERRVGLYSTFSDLQPGSPRAHTIAPRGSGGLALQRRASLGAPGELAWDRRAVQDPARAKGASSASPASAMFRTPSLPPNV
eukprot:jgi/Botrbrau1/5923/Bobra.0366s0097.1